MVRKLEKEGEIEVKKKEEKEEESVPASDKAEVKEEMPRKRRQRSK